MPRRGGHGHNGRCVEQDRDPRTMTRVAAAAALFMMRGFVGRTVIRCRATLVRVAGRVGGKRRKGVDRGTVAPRDHRGDHQNAKPARANQTAMGPGAKHIT